MKQTVEEAAKLKALDICPIEGEATRIFIMGAQFGVEWLSKQFPWISVKDRLPDNDEMVLCLMKSNNAIVSGYIAVRPDNKLVVLTDPNFHFEDLGAYEPKAWMLIPDYAQITENMK